jgi:membrane protease YdiL (CAAX protease family)
MEQKAMELTENLLKVNSAWQFFLNLLIIAIIPAIGEEFLFRGIFQKHFTEISKNAHIAIIITSFIFSAIHFQFFTFLPRFVLGLVLGYIFYWSGNLWLSIFGHFVNNSVAVFVYFIATLKSINIDRTANEIGSNKGQIVYVIISIVFVFFLLYLLKKNHKNIRNV